MLEAFSRPTAQSSVGGLYQIPRCCERKVIPSTDEESSRRRVSRINSYIIQCILYNYSVRKQYFVYILTNHTNSVFYTGVTNNIERRIYEHREKLNPDSFSSKYKLYKLIWFQEFATPQEAIEIEKKIKGFSRVKKLKLVRQRNSLLLNLDK